MVDADKQALENNTAAIKCKLIVQADGNLPSIELTENNSIKDWEYTDERMVPKQGFIGQFVGRTLDGNLQNISSSFDISNREIKLMFGVYRMSDDNTNWYDFGNFIVTTPEDNEVNDNTKFESMDYTKLFNKEFDGDYTDTTFTTSYNDIVSNGGTVTALWLAQYTCAQVGVALGTTNFTNYNFTIDINPFQAGESCRDVMRNIGKLALSWVRIGWDNKCYIDFAIKSTSSVGTYDVIDMHQYYSLETIEDFQPVDGVGFGMENIDGETAFKIKNDAPIESANNIIYVYDNPLLNTFEKRNQAVQQAGAIFDLTFAQLKTETVGHPWLLGTEMIKVKDMENNDHYTYAFNKSIKYTGHIRSKIDSMYITEVEKTLGYTSSMKKAMKNAEIQVNKQEATITQMTSSIQQLSSKENNDYQDVLSRFENYSTDADYNTLQQTVTQLQTDTYTKTEIQQIASGEGADGVKVEAVITESGKFDIDGLLIEKSNAKTKGRFNEVGMRITDATGSLDEELLFAGYDENIDETIVRTKNINVTKYLSIGSNSRMEDYEDGTGVFYIG